MSNSQIVFACLVPHPPLLLPEVGSPQDRAQVKKTIESLEKLGKKLKEINPDSIIISSPHPDWGINVPLYFLLFEQKSKLEFKIQDHQSPAKIIIGLEKKAVYPILTTFDSPSQHFEWGKNFYQLIRQSSNSQIVKQSNSQKIALIASGDLSHCLKEDGPYGFHPHGPKFDKSLIEHLTKKDIENILKLEQIYPQADECGLRSFSFFLGILEASKIDWQPEILSYQAPFGVGYLVVNFKLTTPKIN